ncbi:MAG: hypothetical protein ACYC1E_09615 [Propionibacteriaceae bacterium]
MRLLAFVAAVALVILALVGSALLVEPRFLRSWLLARLAELVAVVVGFAVLMAVERRKPVALEAGLLFAALYAVTRSLWWTIGLHFAWNMVQGSVYGVSGSGSASGWLRTQVTGPAWLTGGSFGIEASVLTVVLLTAVGVWLLVVIRRRSLAVSPNWVRRRVLRARTAVVGESAAVDRTAVGNEPAAGDRTAER